VLARDLHHHEGTCQFRTTTCQRGCGLTILVSDMATHDCVALLKQRYQDVQTQLRESQMEVERLQLHNAELANLLSDVGPARPHDDEEEDISIQSEDSFVIEHHALSSPPYSPTPIDLPQYFGSISGANSVTLGSTEFDDLSDFNDISNQSEDSLVIQHPVYYSAPYSPTPIDFPQFSGSISGAPPYSPTPIDFPQFSGSISGAPPYSSTPIDFSQFSGSISGANYNVPGLPEFDDSFDDLSDDLSDDPDPVSLSWSDDDDDDDDDDDFGPFTINNCGDWSPSRESIMIISDDESTSDELSNDQADDREIYRNQTPPNSRKRGRDEEDDDDESADGPCSSSKRRRC
jgi:hypothetical protein